MKLADDDPRHGTINGYVHLDCRCQDCRAAMRARRRTPLLTDDPRHGEYSTYVNYGCRCDRCKAANSAYMRKYRQGKRRERCPTCGR